VNGGTLLTTGADVLVVDDQEENRELVEELLDAAGYRVRLAADGEAALAEVERELPDCVVLDVMMPRLDGFAVCARLKADPRTQFVPVIMLTALSEVADKVRGLDAGADDFLNKPVRREELLARVCSLVRIKRLRDELDSSEAIIFTMVRALESKDPRSAGHSERVAAAGMAVARRLALAPHEQEAVAKGGMLHDIGKLGVSEDVLFAVGPRSGEADVEYRRHPELGERILLPLRSLASAREVVRHHHERLDGTGFPDGLYGRELSLPAQIVGIVNHYDGLVHEQGWSPDGAATRLREEARLGRFAKEIVETFLESGAAVIGVHGDPEPDAWSEIVPVGEVGRGGTVLVGDDTASNREMFVEVLGEAGYRIVPVESGQAVLDAVQDDDIDLVLLDVRMPGLDGFEVCRRLKQDPATEFLPVVLVTAYADRKDREQGIAMGADDFLSQPVNRHELLARVRSLLRLRTYYRDLEDHQSVVLSLAELVEAKDPYSRGHSARVGELAYRMGQEAGLGPAECDALQMAGLLHDIGKVGIPVALWNKAGALNAEEREAVRSHPAEGEVLCRPLKTVSGVLPFIRHHHERWDGAGYPDGLRGEDIPFGARILAVVDAYEALTSDRAHRPRISSQEALAVLGREANEGRWDPKVFALLAALVKRS
jgi:putative two-component system response regulator